MNTDKLQHIEYKDTIPFIPKIQFGKVIKVYDGDTITVATYFPNDETIYRFSVRLKGLDCPEMRTKNEDEKKCAIMARDFVKTKILNKIVELRDVELEKYGRILANVYCEDCCINDELCENRLAVQYYGGTKQCPTNWLDYYNHSSSV